MLKAIDIHKSYGDLEVLKGISLEIARGEIVAIVGPSGAGKTTLLQILGSLERPTSGSVILQLSPEDSVNLYSLSAENLARFRNRHIGFVFQFHQLLPEFTLLENVAMPALIAGMSRNEAYAHARKFIDYLKLSARVDHRPAALSGGERQRAAVARALVNSPEVVFADEPSGSLDTANRHELHQLFFDIRRDLGTTFLIVTHDTSFAADADRIIDIRDGLISQQ